MLVKPTLEEARLLAKGNRVIPVSIEMFSDVRTPIEVMRRIQAKATACYMLESVTGSESWGRYTFLGYDPAFIVSGTDGECTVQKNGTAEVYKEHPVQLLSRLLAEYKSPPVEGLPPFTGGLVGYFSYDCIKYFEPSLKLNCRDEDCYKDFQLMLTDKVIAFDNFRQKIILIVNIGIDNLEENYMDGIARLKDMERLILESQDIRQSEPDVCREFTELFDRNQYQEMVEAAKAHIVEGDIFQVVLSNRFTAPFCGDLLNTYRILRTTNPSPYMVYLDFEDITIACSSPETLVSLRDGTATTYPLAGTCPRGKTPEEDQELIAALLKNDKELSEHDMLVDLGRNDLGKVCEFGSVKVREYREVKCFSHVSHIASRVTGRMRKGLGALDLLSASLPAGTLSGAPKKRACEIIDKLEGIKRGPYGGALGYIDFAGNMDTCIGIRMAVSKNGTVSVQAGAGIVADSIPENEYKETKNKAQAVINALKSAGEVKS